MLVYGEVGCRKALGRFQRTNRTAVQFESGKGDVKNSAAMVLVSLARLVMTVATSLGSSTLLVSSAMMMVSFQMRGEEVLAG